jgi:hypothetical protein
MIQLQAQHLANISTREKEIRHIGSSHATIEELEALEIGSSRWPMKIKYASAIAVLHFRPSRKIQQSQRRQQISPTLPCPPLPKQYEATKQGSKM